MVVFNQNAVVKSHTMICAATASDRIFLQRSVTRQCFSSIKDAGLRAGDRIDELSGSGRDAAEMRHEIQDRSFPSQKRTN